MEYVILLAFKGNKDEAHEEVLQEKTEMKIKMPTVSNRIIKDFVKKANFAHYEYCSLYKPDGMSANGILGSGGACDEVWDDDCAEKRNHYSVKLLDGNEQYRKYEEEYVRRKSDGHND